MTDSNQFQYKPYRPCAGIALFNREGKVFVGRRNDLPASELAGQKQQFPWQMPQGGIDRNEDPLNAAIRELREETSVVSVQLITEAESWLTYDFPPQIAKKLMKGKFAGQRQMWFAMLFTGEDTEINILTPDGGAHKPEFYEWRWEELENLPGLVIPFKREIYVQLAEWFANIPQKIRLGEISTDP
ncbi:MAG: RNA pyrophosphohydrolase [Devosiaceae bacterium]|nr:RNA pyrophosphohydrolase [Devosiaceae bacterium]